MGGLKHGSKCFTTGHAVAGHFDYTIAIPQHGSKCFTTGHAVAGHFDYTIAIPLAI